MPALKYYRSANSEAAKLPFSDAVRVGDVLYLSGCIGNRPGTREVVSGGMAAEARQAMENVGAVLKANGLGFDDVFKATVMLADMKQWAAFNEIYESYFKPGHLPTRSAFGCAALALGAQLEIECWAYAK
jgi:2-iminobutanoate/2-iminopropanoate deaminase